MRLRSSVARQSRDWRAGFCSGHTVVVELAEDEEDDGVVWRVSPAPFSGPDEEKSYRCA